MLATILRDIQLTNKHESIVTPNNPPGHSFCCNVKKVSLQLWFAAVEVGILGI